MKMEKHVQEVSWSPPEEGNSSCALASAGCKGSGLPGDVPGGFVAFKELILSTWSQLQISMPSGPTPELGHLKDSLCPRGRGRRGQLGVGCKDRPGPSVECGFRGRRPC